MNHRFGAPSSPRRLAAAVAVMATLTLCASCSQGTEPSEPRLSPVASAQAAAEAASTPTDPGAKASGTATEQSAQASATELSEQATSAEVKKVRSSEGVKNSYGVSEAPRSAPADAKRDAKLAEEPQRRHQAVKLGTDVEVVSDVVVQLGKIRAVKAEASLPGEIGGPAISVPVSITNATDAEILTRDVVTDVFFGKDQLPGVPLISSEDNQFPVNLAPGATATATYVVVLPAKAGTTVSVTVNYRAADPIAVFEGTWPGAAGVKK